MPSINKVIYACMIKLKRFLMPKNLLLHFLLLLWNKVFSGIKNGRLSAVHSVH